MIQTKRFVMGAMLALVVLSTVPQNAPLAQEEQQIPTEQAQEMMMQTMMPMMIQAMFGAVLDFFSDPAVAEKEAIHARNFYEALIKRGYSKQEALAIVVGYGSPLQTFSSK